MKGKNLSSSKKGKILVHLQRGQTITPRQAIAIYGSFRLASTINRLRGEGFNINTIMRTSLQGEVFAEYSLKV